MARCIMTFVATVLLVAVVHAQTRQSEEYPKTYDE
jgi:hypothetical protein